MFSKKHINLILTAVVLLFSVFAIIASDSTSKFASPFNLDEEAGESPQIIIDDEVKGATDANNTSLPVVQDESPLPQEDSTDNSSEVQKGYKVVKVIDGDTIDVDVDGKFERLRLIGIDTPETVDPRKKVQCFGKEASNKAKELLFGRFVILESDETQGDRDKYKRLLRYVFLPDGTNFNLYMIAEGYAHEYTYQDPYKYQFDFKESEKQARENNKGLWNPNVCPSQ